MGDLTWSERRRALRVPVRGVAVFYAEDGATHGTIENLSQSGALVSVAGAPADEPLDVELKLASRQRLGAARAPSASSAPAQRWRIAVAFEQRRSTPLPRAIDTAIASALARRAAPPDPRDRRAHRTPPRPRRRGSRARGMTPLAPSTPLEAIDLLTRTQLHVNVCLLAPGFGQPSPSCARCVSDSFPWVSTAEITDDLEATVDRALDAWSDTDVARLASRDRVARTATLSHVLRQPLPALSCDRWQSRTWPRRGRCTCRASMRCAARSSCCLSHSTAAPRRAAVRFGIPPAEVDVGAASPIGGGSEAGSSRPRCSPASTGRRCTGTRRTSTSASATSARFARSLRDVLRATRRDMAGSTIESARARTARTSRSATRSSRHRHLRTWLDARIEMMHGVARRRARSPVLGEALRVIAARSTSPEPRRRRRQWRRRLVAGTLAIGVYVEAVASRPPAELGPTASRAGVSMRIPLIVRRVRTNPRWARRSTRLASSTSPSTRCVASASASSTVELAVPDAIRIDDRVRTVEARARDIRNRSRARRVAPPLEQLLLHRGQERLTSAFPAGGLAARR